MRSVKGMKVLTAAFFALFAFLLAVAGRPAAGAEIESSGGPVVNGNQLAKQIAAPPADFASLRLPNPADLGIRSRSALIPVELSQTAGGQWRWSGELRVDEGQALSLMVLAPLGSQWNVNLIAPSGQTVALNGAAEAASGVQHQTTTFSLGEAGHPADLYTFERAEQGVWAAQVEAAAGSSGSPAGYLLVASQSPYQLYAHLSSHELLAGRSVGLVAYAYDASSSGSGRPTASTGIIEQATLRLTAPDDSVTEVVLSDNGQQGDGAAGDGVFGALINPALAGNYTAQVVALGTAGGHPFQRTSEHAFPVIAPSLTLATGRVQAQVADATRLRLNLPVQASGILPANVTVSAEVWGTQNGQAVPVAWISGLVTPQQIRNRLVLPLSLDGRWITLAGAQAPFELRNVRVQDVNTHIPLSQVATLALDIRSLPSNIEATNVSEEMLMGVRPAAGGAPEMAGKLMLVHGYCSGGVWPTSHFTNYAVFLDANQNRSHDQFAQLIRNYGNQFSSFGVVAHSQGGAASLHLYTYYWSGLDYSTGSRLIQSVGTPYQGTALAGMAAVLGQIFGVGCGTNWDLTYDGASLWLSGIPSWARSRVYFSTTSFTDVWWRYDYCHIASDVLLSDPDDGTTEKWAGQLSGANNMGHKTGWCHTSGMRDPAQYNDASRNSNMNTYANR
jgi:hypothetical protein